MRILSSLNILVLCKKRRWRMPVKYRKDKKTKEQKEKTVSAKPLVWKKAELHGTVQLGWLCFLF